MKKIRLKKIIAYLESQSVDFDFVGNSESEIIGFSSLKNYKDKSITWIKNEEFYNEKKSDFIFCCVTNSKINGNIENQIVVDNSKKIFFDILEFFFAVSELRDNIGTGTYIQEGVKLGENVSIGCNCTIKGHISIGSNTTIGNNVVIVNNVTIGSNCQIQSLSVIGEDGFGYSIDEKNKKTMIKHYGGVIIGDDVFIGSHVNIARGTIDDTIINSGVKIAPTTHIGHNICIGKDAAIICSKLFGSVEVGENAYISSSVIRNQCCVGKNSLVGMGSVVTKDVASDVVVIGVPARKKINGGGQIV